MDQHESAFWDVAAYALGVLDPKDIAGCELHLAECASCAAELEYLLPASTALAYVDSDDLRALRDLEESRLLDRLTTAVMADRRRSRVRRQLAMAAGAAAATAATGLALFAGAGWFASPPPAEVLEPDGVAGEATPPPASAGPTEPGLASTELGPGERFSETDLATGVRADVLVAAMAEGTQLSVALSSLPGPQDCQLLVVTADGTALAAGTWWVSADGFGTSAHPAPLLFQTITPIDRDGIARLELHTLNPDGTTTPLVVVPL